MLREGKATEGTKNSVLNKELHIQIKQNKPTELFSAKPDCILLEVKIQLCLHHKSAYITQEKLKNLIYSKVQYA